MAKGRLFNRRSKASTGASDGTCWNYENAEARRVVVTVGTPTTPTWWCADMEGQERKAVEVTYGGDTFFLDDEDGSGWYKVTHGGGPDLSHKSLPSSSTVV